MSYTAKHYVNVSGRKYTPGEIIDIPIPEEKLKRLLRLKAIAPASSADLDPADDTAGSDEDGGKENVRDNYARGAGLESLIRPSAFSPETGEHCSPDRTATLQPDNLGYDPSGDPKEPQDEEEPTEEEADEEAEAPEIDVMDGIVSAAEEPAEEAPPKKTTSKGRKKA
jgi:hypothetical protein